MTPDRRYPLAPLVDALGITLGQVGGQARKGDHDARDGYAELGLQLGASRTTLRRWRTKGLTEDQADTLAIRCGWLPFEIWPEWLDDITQDEGAA